MDDRLFTDRSNIILSLLVQIDRIANDSRRAIESREPSYLRHFTFLLSKPFTVESSSKTIDDDLIETTPRKDRNFDGALSDRCFVVLLNEQL